MRHARPLLAVAVTALVGAAFAASCSLGLDESLIGKDDAAAPTDAPAADRTPTDAGASDGPPPISPEAGVCTKDDDCKIAGDGCLKPHCDVPRKACVLDVCKPAACASSACDTTARTCAAPKTHKLLAAEFAVGAGVGCGSPRACFAAVYPYVFVGTPNGVLAFAASDPGNATPPPVVVTGLGFVPNEMVASGSRVFFLGGVTGAGSSASSRVQFAWIDVPADPFRKSLAVNDVLATYNRSTSEIGLTVALFPRANDTALLVDENAGQSFPSTPIEPPLVEPVSFGSAALPSIAGTSPEITSGTRMLMGAFNPGAGTGTFGLIANAGGSATQGGDVPVPGPIAPFFPVQAYAVDPSGAVLWVVETLNVPPNTPNPPGPTSIVKAVRATFLLADGASNFDFTQGVDVESYPPVPPGPYGPGAPLVGPAAMLDAKTALVTTADPGNTLHTNVQIVSKQPLGLVAGKKVTLVTSAVGSLAAAASNGYGYVLAAESPTASTVYVFDPACAP